VVETGISSHPLADFSVSSVGIYWILLTQG